MTPSASPRFTGTVARASPGPRITGIPTLPHGIAAVRTRRIATACTRRLSTGPATLPLPITWREQATTPLHPFARSKSPSVRDRTAPEGCPPVRGAWGLDPCPKAWTRRRSSISATRTAREHNRRSPDPRPVRRRSPSSAPSGWSRHGDSPGAALADLPFERASGTDPLRAPRAHLGEHAPREPRDLQADHWARPGFQATPTELSRARGRPLFTDDASRAGTPKGARSKSFAPTRSTRAPPVVGPRQRRLESPAVPGARPACATCGTNASAIPPHRLGLRRTCWPPFTAPRLRPLAWTCTTPRRRARSRGRSSRGPRAASPVPPRRGARFAAPEVPSVDELPTCPWAGLSTGC